MENRKLIIEFLGIEWFIEIPDYDDKVTKGLGIIAPITSVKNGKIARIFDIFAPETECINEAKEHKEFYEICDFEVPQTNHKFTGTFIDALEYIKDTFNQVSKTV
ncbi:hypothetical protein CFT13S00388_02205 [Campylobacter fetus subsp. testudinum]|uniref:hypothetical protein n=1 Tax=Campylobacter fetus TaxID=196 RepID=UPI0008189489|nr:hypothetical protein [Campylobacter fetus]AVK80943.1 hypothetical protein C6B32_03605 [Campylobacter fetus subsp. testudinum]MPB72023.1 hypothetical protein [Campylobacter fetus]MPB77650.1 hypothetical protein [Campylobacter fetus]OCR88270.1 hypothetical protein CFT13S00388_02205 [Campylobacter fetus subsp. testudinum]OCR89660.1 hypothetical protein CFT12S00416_00010 [Campylobacter fetus subsp. testudinum]